MLDAGQRIAQLMASLSAGDQAALQATISQMFETLERLTPLERVSALQCADAAREVAS